MSHPATRQYRAQQAELRRRVLLALRQVWPTLDPDRLDETFPGWVTAVSAVIARNRTISAGLAGRYLTLIRAASGAPGLPPTPPPSPLDEEAVRTSLRVTGPVAVKKAMARGIPLDEATRNAFVLSAGAATRLVLDAGRDTITASTKADPRSDGWVWVSSGRSCKFCDAKAGTRLKGDDLRSHDGCGCSPEPVYR